MTDEISFFPLRECAVCGNRYPRVFLLPPPVRVTLPTNKLAKTASHTDTADDVKAGALLIWMMRLCIVKALLSRYVTATILSMHEK